MAHIHAKSMVEYAKDALKHDLPFKLWEIKLDSETIWDDLKSHPRWVSSAEYRRKPETVELFYCIFTRSVGGIHFLYKNSLEELEIARDCLLKAGQGWVLVSELYSIIYSKEL